MEAGETSNNIINKEVISIQLNIPYISVIFLKSFNGKEVQLMM